MGQTRVDLQHLLEDRRDAYPDESLGRSRFDSDPA
jgi:hypothetical protein